MFQQGGKIPDTLSFLLKLRNKRKKEGLSCPEVLAKACLSASQGKEACMFSGLNHKVPVKRKGACAASEEAAVLVLMHCIPESS